MAARPFWLIILWKEKYAIWVCSLPENCRIVNQICLISGFQFLKNPSNQQTRYVRGKKGLTDKYDNVGPCVVCWVSEKPWLRDPWEHCDLSHMSDDDAKIPISWTSWCNTWHHTIIGSKCYPKIYSKGVENFTRFEKTIDLVK